MKKIIPIFSIASLCIVQLSVFIGCNKSNDSDLVKQSGKEVPAPTGDNVLLDNFAKQISTIGSRKFYKAISDKALKLTDGDKDFIYHIDKSDPAISGEIKSIESVVKPDDLKPFPSA